MLRLGVTGGIGSGKSTVCSIFEQLGVPVYYADVRAKYLVENTTELRNQIVHSFGEKAFENGIYNRAYMASLVFSDSEKLKILNGLIHPFVLSDWNLFCQTHADKPYVIKEAAILLETESKHSVDRIVLVYAPIEIRVTRIKERDGIDVAAIKARMNSQMSEEDKLALADDVIYNDGKHSLIEQVYCLHQKILNR